MSHVNLVSTLRVVAPTSWQGLCKNYLIQYLWRSLGPLTPGRCELSLNEACSYPAVTHIPGTLKGSGSHSQLSALVSGPITRPTALPHSGKRSRNDSHTVKVCALFSFRFPWACLLMSHAPTDSKQAWMDTSILRIRQKTVFPSRFHHYISIQKGQIVFFALQVILPPYVARERDLYALSILVPSTIKWLLK